MSLHGFPLKGINQTRTMRKKNIVVFLNFCSNPPFFALTPGSLFDVDDFKRY